MGCIIPWIACAGVKTIFKYQYVEYLPAPALDVVWYYNNRNVNKCTALTCLVVSAMCRNSLIRGKETGVALQAPRVRL